MRRILTTKFCRRVVTLCLLTCPFWLAAPEVWADQPISLAATLIAQGDALYGRRAELEANEQALGLYEKAVEADKSSAEAQWKAARASWWAGTVLKEDRRAVSFFQKGIDHGKEAVRLNPDTAETHFWLASNYGSYGYVKGAITSLRLIKSIRKEMAEVLRLNPSYLSGGADRVLGILDYKVPGIVGGDKKKAKIELERALAYDTAFPVTYYYLAEYSDVMGQQDLAREYLAKLNSLPPSETTAPELAVIADQAKALRQKLKI